MQRLPAASVAPIISDYETKIAAWQATTTRIRDARRADTAEGRREAITLSHEVAFGQFNAARECINQLTELLDETDSPRITRIAADRHPKLLGRKPVSASFVPYRRPSA